MSFVFDAIVLGVSHFRIKGVTRRRPATAGVPRTLRRAISAFTRVVDALLTRGPLLCDWVPDPRAPSALHRVGDSRSPSLPQRLQNLHQLGVDEFVAADHVAGFQRVVVAFDA